MKRIVSLMIAVLLLMGMFTGCGGQTSNAGATTTKPNTPEENIYEGIGNDPYADYTVSGTVVVAIDTARATDYQPAIDALREAYPDIDLQVDYYSHTTEDNASEYLISRASVGKLPDVVFDEAGRLPLYISQGWVYPLNEFVEGDPVLEDVPENFLEDYTYGGKLYALPNGLTFQTIALNIDLLDEMNLDHPELDWTFADYEELMKEATNNKYSGTDTLHTMEQWGAGILGENVTLAGYNYETRSFQMTESFAESLKLMRSLRTKVAGLEAWSLSTTSGSSGKSDYEIKFGLTYSGATKHEPFYQGMTLSCLETGTWSRKLLTEKCNFEWELWPVPQNPDAPGKLPMHVDHSFMTSTAAYPDAAFQVLRFLTYSVEGNLARLDAYEEENEGLYDLNGPYYIPATLNEEVAEKFSNLIEVDEAAVYMYENMGNSFRADPKKIVPGWTNVDQTVIMPASGKVTDGQADALATCAELETKATEALKEYWDDFEEKLAKVQADFENA